MQLNWGTAGEAVLNLSIEKSGLQIQKELELTPAFASLPGDNILPILSPPEHLKEAKR